MSLHTLLNATDLTSSREIYNLLNTVSGDDSKLYRVLRILMLKGGTPREVANEAIESICYFYTDSPSKFMALLARDTVKKVEGVKERQSILDKHSGDLTGCQMVNSSGRAYIVFLPDSAEPGRVRYSCFDSGGFFSHSTFNDYPEALEDAWRSGFRIECDDVLSAISLTNEWQAGSECTAMVQLLNLENAVHARSERYV